MYTVYLIDDEKWALYDVQHTCPFAEYGFSVAGAQTNPFAALDEVIELRPDAVFVDVRMPQVSGLDLIRMIQQRAPETAFVILSGYAEFSYAATALRLGAVDYCLKPMDAPEARGLLERLRGVFAQPAGRACAGRAGDRVQQRAVRRAAAARQRAHQRAARPRGAGAALFHQRQLLRGAVLRP